MGLVLRLPTSSELELTSDDPEDGYFLFDLNGWLLYTMLFLEERAPALGDLTGLGGLCKATSPEAETWLKSTSLSIPCLGRGKGDDAFGDGIIA